MPGEYIVVYTLRAFKKRGSNDNDIDNENSIYGRETTDIEPRLRLSFPNIM